MSRRTWIGPWVLAVLTTLLNAAKPPCVDDPAYLAVARQIARKPWDPYGFEQFWYDRPQPAHEVLAPPVLPFWLALGLVAVGDRPFLLKCFLFPFACLLTTSLHDLLRRAAPAVALPALVAIVFSPFLLPAFNFMLDVPAFALSCTAIRLFLSAARSGRASAAGLAGLAAGLAMQTKYTGLLVLPVVFLIALISGRVRLGSISCGLAATIFVAWELYTASRYGQSHFLLAWQTQSTSWADRFGWTVFGIRLLGSVGLPLILLGAASMTRLRSAVLLIAGAWIAMLAGYALSEDRRDSVWLPPEERIGSGYGRWMLTIWGSAVLGVLLGAVARSAGRERLRGLRSPSGWLLCWFVVEIAGFFLMSPFPAARRVLGSASVGCLLLARSMKWSRPKKGLIWLTAGLSAGSGCFFALTDLADAQLEPQAVRAAVEWIRTESAVGEIWYVGHWGTQEAAERAGCQPWIPGRSRVQPGDWLLIPSSWIVQPQQVLDDSKWQWVNTVSIDRRWTFRTLPPYYGGDQSIEVWPNPMIQCRIYRARSNDDR